MSVSADTKAVSDVVDGGGLYFSRAASAGGWIFFSSTAVDASGAIASGAEVKNPYRRSPAAHARSQTTYVFDAYHRCLEELGSSIDDVVQVEQYIPRKAYADGYLEISRGPGNLERQRPGSALMQLGDGFPDGVVITQTGIAVVPDADLRKETFSSGIAYGVKLPELGGIYAQDAPFSEIITAGPYVFTTLFASDYRTGVHPDAKVPDWAWWGNEIRSEAQWMGEALERKLAVVDTNVGNAVHCSVYLVDMADLYELDRIWRQIWPDSPPARTVVPVRGLGVPRAEGAKGHAEDAIRMEIQFRSLRPGHGAEREVIGTGTDQVGREPEAVKAGPLLWISGQVAGDEDGLLTAPDARSQLRYILDRIVEIAEAGGSSASNLLRVRAYVTDPDDGYALYAALKERIPRDPPCVCVAVVPGPLQVPGCSMIVDAVAYAP